MKHHGGQVPNCVLDRIHLDLDSRYSMKVSMNGRVQSATYETPTN
jgi:hypothetical protein